MAENRNKQIIIRVKPSEDKIITKAAELDGRTKSDYARRSMLEKAQKLIASNSINS